MFGSILFFQVFIPRLPMNSARLTDDTNLLANYRESFIHPASPRSYRNKQPGETLDRYPPNSKITFDLNLWDTQHSLN
jgi:hypothetical protein